MREGQGREGGREDGGSVREVYREGEREKGRVRNGQKEGGVGLLQPTETGRVRERKGNE